MLKSSSPPRDRSTRDSLACDTTPLFLSLSFSPFSHFIHLEEIESQAQLSQQHSPCQNLASRRHTKLIPKRRDVRAPAYMSADQLLHGVNYNRGSASGRGTSGGELRHWRLKKKKRQRQKHAHHWQQFTRDSSQTHDCSRQNFNENQSN